MLAAATVSAALSEFTDAGFIFLVLAINTIVGATQEARAEASTTALRNAIRTVVRVTRGGRVVRLDSRELVPGDIVLLEAGDRIPADMRLVRAARLQVDESALTGELLAIDKVSEDTLATDTVLAERVNCLHAGTLVRAGTASGLVTETGTRTEFGQIAGAMQAEATVPPLTKRLNRFTTTLGLVSMLAVVAIIGPRLIAGGDLQSTLLVAIALAISIIPEGLPVAVTVALSIAASRMARHNVVVRRLPAVEGLGACTVVATDKTGTLTVNQLTAKLVWLPGHGMVAVGGEGYRPVGEIEVLEGRRDGANRALGALGRSAVLSSNATYDPETGPDGASGDTVDLALLVLAAKAAVEVAEIRTGAPRVAEVPFSAERRFAASLNRHNGGDHQLHVKGAPEVILPLCQGIDTEAVLTQAETMAADGYRIIAVATRGVAAHWPDELETEVHSLTLLGLVAFIDPLRPEAKKAVSDCHRAGVVVKMITGDHAATALAIARQLGIAFVPEQVVTGRDLAAAAGDPAAMERIATANVFARIEPAQKVQIVAALQAAGHFVAMTGDGVNDAPALMRADVGVAMGKDGTDAAREASDLILTDDNFASIVSGIEQGRAAYANIRKVVYLLISTGAAEAVMFLLAMLTGLPLPLGAVQLLWLNLVTNGGQDVALAFERPEPNLLDRPPRSPKQAIFDGLMIRQTVVSGLYMGIVGYGFFAWALSSGFGEVEARNALLFLMVLFENVHALNARSETRSLLQIPFFGNRILLGAVAGAQGLHIAAPYIPWLRDALEVQPISLGMWGALVGLALSLLVVMEIEKRLRAGHGAGTRAVTVA